MVELEAKNTTCGAVHMNSTPTQQETPHCHVLCLFSEEAPGIIIKEENCHKFSQSNGDVIAY